MPDVPNVPGVPALSGYSAVNTVLDFADGLLAGSGLLQVGWGIFLDGEPIITPASLLTQQIGAALGPITDIAALIGFPNVVPVTGSMIEFEFSANSPISNYPQENGAFASYNKVQLPFDVRVKIACSGSSSQRQAFFDTLEALRTSVALVDVVTPEKVYTSCNCKHVDYRRTASSGVELVVADIWFEQVNALAATAFSNTQQPGSAGQQSIGNVQPQTPTPAVEQQFSAQQETAGFF